MATTYLSRTPSSAGNRKTFTISAWLKRGTFNKYGRIISSYVDDNNRDESFFHETTQKLYFESVNSSSQVVNMVTTRKFKDINAWYHLVIAVDTTQSTASNRVKIYINGVQETAFDTETYPSQNYDFNLNNNIIHYIGRSGYQSGSNSYFDGCMSHFHFVDGSQLAPTVFGSTDSVTGEWNINTSPSYTVGTNGFFILKNTNSGTDESTNSNNFTASGSLTKTEDNPSNIFATINILLGADVIGSTVEFSAGNTLASDPNGQASGINPNFISTLGMPSKGKWYCEVQPSSFSTSSGHSIGIYRTKGSTDDTGLGDLEGNNSKIRYIYADTSIYIIKYGSNDQTGLTSISSGQTVGMALDLDNGTLQYYVDGSARANPITGINSANDGYDYFFHAGLESSSSGRYGIYSFNFGNGAFGSTQLTGTTYNDSQGRGIFKYQPPTNFLALCTKNLNV